MEDKKEKVFAALNDLDVLDSELEDVIHLVSLLDEGLTDDLDPIKRGEPWGAKYLLDRWPLHQSMLNVIRYRLVDILEDLQEGLNKGYGVIDVQR